jgi:hypothetical protein
MRQAMRRFILAAAFAAMGFGTIGAQAAPPTYRLTLLPNPPPNPSGYPDGYNYNSASDINEKGQVVGTSRFKFF